MDMLRDRDESKAEVQPLGWCCFGDFTIIIEDK